MCQSKISDNCTGGNEHQLEGYEDGVCKNCLPFHQEPVPGPPTHRTQPQRDPWANASHTEPGHPPPDFRAFVL
jgi:hypothetical protein